MRHLPCAIRSVLVTCIALLLVAHAQAENWPGWRGPTGVGYTAEKDLPLTWNGKTGENVLWKVALNAVGHSGPIVWGDRVFVTLSRKQSNAEQDAKVIPEHWVACFQIADGKELWRTMVPPGSYARGYSQYAVATPATDGQRIYSWFGSGAYAALDLEGKIVWRQDLPGPFPKNAGPEINNSPVVFEDVVIRVVDQPGGHGFVQGLFKATGEVKWEKKLPKVTTCGASPILLPVNGRQQLIVPMSNAIEGLDPASGATIWSCKGSAGSPSPAYGSGLLHVYGVPRNVPQGLTIDPRGTGDVTSTHVKWQLDKADNSYLLSSPVIGGDYVYRAHHPGILHCWELATGKELYAERLEGVPTVASPIVTADDRIYFAGTGKSYVIKGGPKLEVLATNELGGESRPTASPAIAGGKIVLRDSSYLYCIGKK